VYHNFGTLEPGPGWTGTAHATPLGDQANYPDIRNPQRLSGQGSLRLKWTLSDKLSLEFWQAASGGDVYLGLTGINNADTCIVGDDAPSVFVRTAGKSQRFATVLQPLKGESRVASIEPAGGEEDLGVVLRFRDGRAAKLLFRPGRTGKDAIAVE
jgi:hypothetical protein